MVHCCVLQISCIQGTPLYPVSCRTLQFLAMSAMNGIILTHTHLVLLSISNFLRAVLCLPRFWDPQSVVLTSGPSHMSALALPQILMFCRLHVLKVVSQVVLKKTVIVHLTLRLCGQRVHVVYGDWQIFLPIAGKLYFKCPEVLRSTAGAYQARCQACSESCQTLCQTIKKECS